MGSGIKLAAEKLMKIASELEKEASVNTYFVCDRCNHTASLSEINSRRKVAAEESTIEHVAAITVNDIITCVACGGKMAYVPTEDSEKYYVEAEEDDLGDDIFEPVDEREETKETDILEETPSETPSEAPSEAPPEAPPETPEETPEGAPEEAIGDKEEIKTEEISEGLPESDEPPALEDKTDEDISVDEETVPEDTSDISDDETMEESDEEEDSGVNLPKKDVPKFEKIPKEAQLGFWKAVAKYSL
jgi:hypothetical protein